MSQTLIFSGGGPFTLDDARYTGISKQTVNLTRDVEFDVSGNNMFIPSAVGDRRIQQYSLTSPYDISTAVTSQSVAVCAQDTGPNGISFRTNGLKMFIVGQTGNNIYEYALASAWSVSTASFTTFFSVSAQTTTPTGVFFKSDGSKMFITGRDQSNLFEYAIASAWSVSTASIIQGVGISANGSSLLPSGLEFNNIGNSLFIMQSPGTDEQERIIEYALSSAWDISNMKFVQSFEVSAESNDTYGIAFNRDGTEFFVAAGNRVFKYTT